MYNGVLLVDKPKGWTSHDVVAKIRNNLKKQSGQKIKVGHTGTLDPMADGLLVLVIGTYTKRAGEFSRLDKTYEAKIKLGYTSTTGDSEGAINEVSSRQPSPEEVKTTLRSFLGQSLQTPPAYSAVKVNGERAYKLARKGKEVQIQPKDITIYDISKITYKYPNISFVIRVSSGTYIRSIAEDIGKKLKTGGYLTDLKRTNIDNFKLEDAILPTDINLDKIKKI